MSKNAVVPSCTKLSARNPRSFRMLLKYVLPRVINDPDCSKTLWSGRRTVCLESERR